MFNFAPDQNQRSAVDLIPPGTPLLCAVNVEEVKRSQNSGGMTAKLCFTVTRGPYERRKMWMYVGDPNDESHSEKYRQMSLANLQHMLESSGIFNPTDVSTYARYSGVAPEHAFNTILKDLDGKYVAVKAKTEKGQDGYDDRTVPGVILSPNPNGRTFRSYGEVKAGADTQVQKPAAGAFGQPAAPQNGFSFGGQAPAPAGPAQQESSQSSAPNWLKG